MRALPLLAWCLTSALGLPFAPVAAAQEPELPAGVHEDLVERVRAEVAARWDVETARVALDVASPRGDTPLPAGAAHELVGSGSGGHWVIRTSAADGSLHSLRIRAGVWTPVAVAGRRIERGEALLASDIVSSSTIRWGEPPGTDATVREGWVAQRLIREGEPLASPAVQPPLAVRSGDAVQLVWARGGVGVRTSGRAAGSATVGQQIYVRTATGTRLKGVVVAPGLVNVTQGGTE